MITSSIEDRRIRFLWEVSTI